MSRIAERAARRNQHGKVSRKKSGPSVPLDRLTEVEDMLLSGEKPAYICRTLAPKYGVTEQTIKDDLLRINAELEAMAPPPPDELRQQRLREVRQGYMRCRRAGDEKGARAWFDMLIRIEGHYAPDALKLTTSDITDLQLLPQEELDRIVDEGIVRIAKARERAAEAHAALNQPAEAVAAEPDGVEDHSQESETDGDQDSEAPPDDPSDPGT